MRDRLRRHRLAVLVKLTMGLTPSIGAARLTWIQYVREAYLKGLRAMQRA